MEKAYSALAHVYDRLNGEVDYEAYADYVAHVLQQHGIKEGELVLDLACGTGALTLPLSLRGYDMIGVDLSPEMLGVARDRAAASERDVLFLCQDMRSFELYGTVRATVCALDSLNYLTGKGDLSACFSLVHNYLDPDGLFLFDMNTPYKFENLYAGRDFIFEDDGIYCGWQNFYHPSSKICEFYLSIFEETKDGKWKRTDELQRERAYSLRTVKNELSKAGFRLLSVSAGQNGEEITPESERWYFVAQAIKS